MSLPKPERLPDGAILAPQRQPDGSHVMRRIEPDDPEHALWADRARTATDAPWGLVALGLLVPVAGLVAVVVLFAQSRPSHAAAVLMSSVIGSAVALAILL